MTKYVQRKFYYISLNLGPAAGPVQAITIALQLPIIETRVTILLGLARADDRHSTLRRTPHALVRAAPRALQGSRGEGRGAHR